VKFDPKHPAYVIGFAALVSAAFTAAIMTFHQVTAAQVRRNEELYEQKALVELFGLGDVERMTSAEIDRLVTQRIERGPAVTDPMTGRSIELIRAYDKDKAEKDAKLIGYAVPISGVGFWARIDGLIALKPDLGEVLGVVFLSHSETPGLGGRITEKQWRDRFRGLIVSPPSPGVKYIYVGGGAPPGSQDPRYRRYVDAITGATGTSTAVAKFIDENLRQFRRAAEAAGLAPPASDPPRNRDAPGATQYPQR
jgi:Na+-transporting NADH:ubiquinone oxidoreductase subunit C